MKGAVVVATLAFVLVFLLAAPATAQDVDGGWTGWSDCTRQCDLGSAFRSCTNPPPSGNGAQCEGPNHMSCNPQACVNCTVTPWWYSSGCSATCGGGTRWIARRVIQEPEAGGTPCPVLNYTTACNTDMCQARIPGYGYAVFGPLKGPGPLSFTFRRGNEEVDAYLFDQRNFEQYQFDARRAKPFQTNYAPLASLLEIQTVKSTGPITLDTNTNYYLVVDHTYIGVATGTNNGNGGFDFNPNTFYYFIRGLEVPPVSFSGDAGVSAASPVATLSAAAMLLVASLAAMLL